MSSFRNRQERRGDESLMTRTQKGKAGKAERNSTDLVLRNLFLPSSVSCRTTSSTSMDFGGPVGPGAGLMNMGMMPNILQNMNPELAMEMMAVSGVSSARGRGC